jgi:hypothetical protein
MAVIRCGELVLYDDVPVGVQVLGKYIRCEVANRDLTLGYRV